MNLIQAKQLEYALDIYEEFATTGINKINDYPDLKVIWNYHNQLITCNTFKNQDGHPILNETRNGSDFRASAVNFNDSPANSPFMSVRHEIFSKLQDNIHEYLYLYENPEHLLKFLIEDIKQLDESLTENIDTQTLYNVKKINGDHTLKFLLVDQNTELTPVSLISISKD
ncbi:hypothetical protein [Companilactobacillus muriivasis]|uniref:hypothetical protein n=1 Tax=Companilactobacillus muriivasis TaxID=3081444 RepID=UPI0030C6B188